MEKNYYRIYYGLSCINVYFNFNNFQIDYEKNNKRK